MTSRLVAKRVLGAVYSLRPTPARRRVVLLYHSIGSSPLGLAAEAFRSQMKWLSSAAAIVSLSDLIEGRSAAPLQAAITFDDGYASLHDVALPALREAGAMAAVFLNTGWIDADERRPSDVSCGHYPQEKFMRWGEVKNLSAAGWEVGSHGVNHFDLTAEPDDVVRTELTTSRNHIVGAVGVCSPVFAYTWGRHTQRLRQLVAEAGYSHAVAGVHAPLAAGTDRYAIPRIDVARDYTLEDFKAIVRGDWDYLGWVQQARNLKRTHSLARPNDPASA